jgi:two-component system OmpR family response regulator
MRHTEERTSTLQRILIVDDDPDILAIAQFALEQVGGFTVAICNSGHEALGLAPMWRPDLIILDLMMPEMDGWQTLTALRSIPAMLTTPVMILSATIHPDTIALNRGMRVIGSITKPFDPMTFSQEIHALWHSYHSQADSLAI